MPREARKAPAMPREAWKAPGILKNNHMECAGKALNSGNVVGTNSSDTVTPDTPKVTPERKFLPYSDPKNSPSWDDNDNSTSYSSYPDMKVWPKKESKTIPVQTRRYLWLRLMPASVLDHPLLQQKPVIMVVVLLVLLVLL